MAKYRYRSDKLIRTFSALGDKTRFSIVKEILRQPDICVSEIARELGISVSAVSQQCRLLELSGLIERKRSGQKVCYELRLSDPLVSKTVRFAYAQKKLLNRI